MTPVTLLSAAWTGRYTGWASPNTRWQMAMVSSKSERGMSSLLTATMRGIPTAAHSCQSSAVAPSMPSAPEMTKMAASAARSPARSSPMKSG